MKSHELTASNLRILLSVTLVLIAALGVGLFIYFHGVLDTYAQEVGKSTADAETSVNKLSNLDTLKNELENQREAIDRANKIVAEKTGYAYQDEVIKDIQEYASRHQITIINYDFIGSSAAAPNGATTSASSAASADIEGAKPTTVRIEINNPSTYPDIVRFIYDIERNLTKMQISRVELQRQQTKEQPQGVALSAFEIEVYIKEKAQS